ncbi:MAG: type II toxin-antitoxin system RelE/ParE family toxin [Oscillospiraceae bacterium]|nr:type II toxin-antitoxin system RelE/ParE family toxin [Oscillospiraceae bacterium]
MSNIHYTPEAEDDLAGIKEYITEELDNPIAAINTVTRITKRIRCLEQFLEMGAQLSAIINIVSNYRYLVCANYMAFYRIEGKEVYIIRILYGSRDCVKTLFGEFPPDKTE